MTRIGCIGNMNNSLSALSRYLRDRGHAVELLCLPYEHAHFSPEADTRQRLDWVHRVPWGHFHELKDWAPDRIARALDHFDVLIGCGTAPAYAAKAGRRLDILCPYGEEFMSYSHKFFPRVSKWLRCWHAVRYERMGIRASRHILMDPMVEDFENLLTRLHPAGQRHYICPPYLYLPDFDRQQAAQLADAGEAALFARAQGVRAAAKVLLFHQSRHHWQPTRRHYAWELKGNDKLIQALRLVRERRPGLAVKVITFEYGKDVRASKALAEQLGVTDMVEWFPLSPRRVVGAMLRMSDLGVSQLGRGWFSYGSRIEILAAGRPVIAARDDERYAAMTELYPMARAESPDDVARHILAFADDPAPWLEMGAAGRRWIERHLRKGVDLVESIIAASAARTPAA